MENIVRCNWCGFVTEKWCWQQKQKDGSIIAKCQKCVDEGRVIPIDTRYDSHCSGERSNSGGGSDGSIHVAGSLLNNNNH